jgi:transposase-like protein
MSADGLFPKPEAAEVAGRCVDEPAGAAVARGVRGAVSTKSLRDWHQKFAPRPEPCGDNATVDELREEVKRLRRQLKRADMEREILKKATAYFAKESL